MTETMMQEILKRLDLIGAKLGEGGEFAWQTYLRQAYVVDGVLTLVGGLVALIVALPLLWLAWKYRDADIAIGVGFVALAMMVMGIFTVSGAVHHILNPAYYALMDLAKLVGR